MVGPGEDDDERRKAMNRLKFAIVALVGVSAGLVTLSGGGSALQVGVAVLGGLAVGAVLLAYLVWIA